MKKLLLIAAAAIALTMPRVVSAHHGWGGYLDEEFEISGTVATPVSLAGPHATMRVLTALPLTGPLLALAVGVSPLDLYGHPAAAGSVVTGIVLLVLGRAGTSRMVRAVSAERQGAIKLSYGRRVFGGRRSERADRNGHHAAERGPSEGAGGVPRNVSGSRREPG